MTNLSRFPVVSVNLLIFLILHHNHFLNDKGVKTHLA